MKKNNSISTIINEVFYWNSKIKSGFIIVFIVSFSIFVAYQDQKSGCTVAQSIFNQYNNSISRELLLENKEVAKANFNSFKNELKIFNLTNNITINFDVNENNSVKEQCTATPIVSYIEIPIIFAGIYNGLIKGYIFYFPSLWSIIILWILGAFLFFSIKKSAYKLKIRLNNLVINPLMKLSYGEEIENINNSFAEEVVKIDKNLKQLKTKILEKERLELESKSLHQLSLLAAQVSHDLASPLMALNLIINNLNQISEDKRIIIRNSLNRINDISNDFLIKSREKFKSDNLIENQESKDNGFQIELLPAIVDILISEKRIHYREKKGIKIETNLSESYGSFVNIKSSEFKRTLSNIINNSCESFKNFEGKILITLTRIDEQIFIFIKDNGSGIPPHILEKIGERGFTFGKKGPHIGSGLGLWYALKTIQSFGGKLDISSKYGQGTTVSIILPTIEPPKWFVERIIIKKSAKILCLDDDMSIHVVWKERFSNFVSENSGIGFLSFTSAEEFKNYLQENPSQSIDLYLIDFELLNQNYTGLDIIEICGIFNQSILVTSRYEEIEIRRRCEKLNVRLIPKTMVGHVPISLFE